VEIKGPQHEDELDARLSELFRSAGPLEPSAGFAARTMKAVRVEPLPAGRRALRHPWSAPVGWTMLVGATAMIVYGVFVNEAVAAQILASVIAVTLHAGAQLVRYLVAVLAMTELFATLGNAVSRAAATREGTTTLMWTAAVAGSSLLALQRLLFSKGEESQWQEL
jgi:hypothetical protein